MNFSELLQSATTWDSPKCRREMAGGLRRDCASHRTLRRSRPAVLTCTVRCRPIRRCPASPAGPAPRTLVATVPKRRRVPPTKPVSTSAVLWAAGAVVVAVHSISALISKLMDEPGKLLLNDLDSFADNRIGREIPGALNVEVESVRDGIVVERLALLRGLLPPGILAWGPVLCKSAYVREDHRED